MADWEIWFPFRGEKRKFIFPDFGMSWNFMVWLNKTRPYTGNVTRVLDIGGCAGAFTLALLEHGIGAEFDIFEPSSVALPYLYHNTEGIEGITIHELGASSSNKTALLYSDENLGKYNLYDGETYEEVQLVRLDDVIDGPVDVIKLDVEGHELEALQGANGILEQYHPRIIIEAKVGHMERAGYTPDDALNQMKRLGYRKYSKLVLGSDYVFDYGSEE